MERREDGAYEFRDGARRVLFQLDRRPQVYNITLELPPGGGDSAGIEYIRECIDAMFNETPALVVCGMIHKDNAPSRVIAGSLPWVADPSRDLGEYTYRYTTIGRWINIRGAERMARALLRRPSK